MTAPVFHLDPLPAGDRLVLEGPEGRHAAVVRRLEVGEQVHVTDGRGAVAECTVARVLAAGLELDVRTRRELPAPAPRLVVVQALPKGDRGELAVELLTEVGVDEVVPWGAARCITQWKGERGAKALERWRSTAREAAKQSRRSWWPVVSDLATTRVVAERLRLASLAVVLHEEASESVAGLEVPVVGEVVIVVGPEGGITEQELETLGAKGFHLGSEVLRTSTAGVVAAAALLSRSPRWG